MGFFDRYYYGKAGKRDYSEMDMPKNRVSLFFLVLKDHFWDMIKLNFLQLPFWLPALLFTYILLMTAVQVLDVQTMMAEEGAMQALGTVGGLMKLWLLFMVPAVAITGPSTAGAAYVMRNWSKDQHAFLFSDYKDALKDNWKQALGVSALVSVVPMLTYTAVVYYGSMAPSNPMMLIPLVIVFSAVLVAVLTIPLLYPMMVGYELRFSTLLRNGILMALASMPKMALTRIITALPIVILLAGMYVGNTVVMIGVVLYYILFGFALTRLVYASVANSVFDRYLNPHIEGAKVGEGLRPHTEEDDLDDLDDLDDEDDEDDE